MSSKKENLKDLKNQLRNQEIKLENFLNELNEKQDQYLNHGKTVKGLRSKIKKIEGFNSIGVSDHAIVRYFERVLGVDIEEVKSKICTDEIKNLTSILGGNGTFPLGENKIVIKHYSVVTIL